MRLLLVFFVAVTMCTLDSARAGVPQDISRCDTSVARSDTLRTTDEPELRWYTMFSNLPGDWSRWSRETFQSDNVPAFVGMAVSTGALIATDNTTWKISHRLYSTSSSIQHASDVFEYIGDGRPQFGLAGAFALGGFVFSDGRALRTGSELVEVILSCGGVVQVIKHVTGRQSPFVSTEPRGDWSFFPNQIQYAKHVPRFDAFPSGHIATTLATVTVIAENYPEEGWLKPVGYTLVGMVGFGLANTGVHWYSDYPLGLSLGYAFGKIAAHPLLERQSDSTPSDTKVSVIPELTRRGGGLAMVVSF